MDTGEKSSVLGSISSAVMMVLLAVFPIALHGEETHRNYSPYADRHYPENVYWGDAHLHTSRSADAFSFGDRFPPEVAYRFARGATVETNGGQPVRISRPLDFLVISDHAHFLGFGPLMEKRDPEFLATDIGKRLQMLPEGDLIRAYFQEWGQMTAGSRAEWESLPKGEGKSLRRSIWHAAVEEADRFNDPGRFTAFIGFEWTSMPDGSNLHRVVVFRDGGDKAGQVLPFGVGESRDPQDLWAYLRGYEESTSGRILAIPHNGNMSRGGMFADRTYAGEMLTQGYAETRARWEPLYEVTQVKGDGETHPALSPDDRFADYETWYSFTSIDDPNAPLGSVIVKDRNKAPQELAAEYARSALRKGLAFEQQLGVNPFKFGMIGSSDIHTSLTTVEEDSFFAKMPYDEPSPDRAMQKIGMFAARDFAASGLAAVWAHENTRESLFDAMGRRETYATTGPRITLRFFGGWEFDALDSGRPDYVAIGYHKGVPMGGDLTRAPHGKAPRFLIVAAKDPDGANLERIQVVKGWVDEAGETHEKVWDVLLSDDRKPSRRGAMAPAIGSTVDVSTATYTNTVGEAQLATVWEDPKFDPVQRAFYYVRVLEIPTPRWTTYDAAFYGTELLDDVPAVHQERAYSSPIWYTP